MGGSIEVQSCSRCRSEALVHQAYSGQHLCGKHLASSIRKRTSKELRIQLDLPKDATRDDGKPFRVLVAVSGGKDSAVLLSMMSDIIGRRRDVELVAGCVDEGIDGYRAPSMEFAKQLAESLDVRFETMSYEEMGFGRMDEVVQLMPTIGQKHSEANGLMPCSYCGVFRRQSLNSMAESLDADVMALGHNLDDMAQSVLMNLQKGEIERSVRLAPHTKTP
ncbi:MAG: tRNA 2-thiocytidine biosynthesis TtcA family protein, partial [Candidatus Thermoplasmatota archaeon]|nr:tRNA 2-thiocytidine biosynthesis TtcA family protein [Candidatus Thermoplasmatota archaeon]